MLLVLLACAPRKTPDTAALAREGEDSRGEDSGDTTDSDGGDTGESDTGESDTDGGDTETTPRETVELSVDTDAWAKILGETPPGGGDGTHDWFRAAAAGDVDGDGVEDVVTTCMDCGDWDGRAWLVSGPLAGTVSVADATATFVPGEAAWMGYRAVAAGDVDGDGFGELLVTTGPCRASGDTDNCVLLVPGPVSGALDPATVARATLIGEYVPAEDLYTSVTGDAIGVGDFDGDGVTDVFVSARSWDVVGAAYVVTGPVAGDLRLASEADFTFVNDDEDGLGGVTNLGDVDGDGRDDLAIGEGNDTACVSVFDGPLSGTVGRADADATFVSPGEEQIAAYVGALAAAGDVDGDGYADALVVSRGLRGDGMYGGGAYVVRGPLASEVPLADAAAILYEGGEIRPVADGPGDVDGDGRDDLAFGSGYFEWPGDGPGETFVALGPFAGAVDLQEAAFVVHGAGTAHVGAVLDSADFDGDGLGDLLLTGPEDTEGGGYAGAAWIVGGFDER